jgi:hypothetical protein
MERVIENFRHKGLAKFFQDDDRRKVPVSQADKIARILAPRLSASSPEGGTDGFLGRECIQQLAHHLSI